MHCTKPVGRITHLTQSFPCLVLQILHVLMSCWWISFCTFDSKHNFSKDSVNHSFQHQRVTSQKSRQEKSILLSLKKLVWPPKWKAARTTLGWLSQFLHCVLQVIFLETEMFSQILLACLNAKRSFKTHWKPCQHHDPFLISLTSCNVLAQHLLSESLPQNYHSLNLRMCFCKDVCVLASKVAPSDPHILVGTTLVWSPSTFHRGWSV